MVNEYPAERSSEQNGAVTDFSIALCNFAVNMYTRNMDLIYLYLSAITCSAIV
jgi:hypothetical protein